VQLVLKTGWISPFLSKVQLASWSYTFLVKSPTAMEYRLGLHISCEKCNSYWISVCSCIFLVKSTITMEYRFELHISCEKCNSYWISVCSYIYLVKSATIMEYRLELHISREKCNSYWISVCSCIFIVKSATHNEYQLLVAHFWRKSASILEKPVRVAHILQKVQPRSIVTEYQFELHIVYRKVQLVSKRVANCTLFNKSATR
jgi:uncharacterized membrane protein